MFKLLKIRRAINCFIRTRPKLFIGVMSRRKKFKDIIVNKDTEIVIEGYPRSANTFAVAAFEFSQNRTISIARHTHAPAQIICSAKCGLPIILLIRNPIDAVISLVIRDNTITLKYALKMYVWYHEAVLGEIDKCVIADFSEVTSDFSRIIDLVNQKYNTEYHKIEHNKENVNRIFDIVEKMELNDSGGELRESHVSRPSESRADKKMMLLKQLESDKNYNLLKKCKDLYEEILSSRCKVL